MIQDNNIEVLRDRVVVYNMNFSERKTAAGIVLTSDDGKSHGVRPRWAKVLAVGPEQKDVAPGEWVLVEHGRWTHGWDVDVAGTKHTARMVDADCILLVSDQPTEEAIKDSV